MSPTFEALQVPARRGIVPPWNLLNGWSASSSSSRTISTPEVRLLVNALRLPGTCADMKGLRVVQYTWQLRGSEAPHIFEASQLSAKTHQPAPLRDPLKRAANVDNNHGKGLPGISLGLPCWRSTTHSIATPKNFPPYPRTPRQPLHKVVYQLSKDVQQLTLPRLPDYGI